MAKSSEHPESRPRRTVRIRERVDTDAPQLIAALAEVHRSDAYPIADEHVDQSWLYDPSFEMAWVAEVDGQIIGHVALMRGFGAPVVEKSTGRPAAETLGVTRLFVGHAGRGSGAATALLDTVDRYAVRSGLALALDVVDFNTTAVELYERRGWRRVGSYVAQWFGPDGPHPTAHYYVAPYSYVSPHGYVWPTD